MKSGKEIAKDLGNFILLAIEANLGISGEEWDYDGASPRGWFHALSFNALIATLLGILTQSFTVWVLSFIFLEMWVFFIVGFMLPLILDYLEVNFKVYGLTEEQAENIYGRKMKVVNDNQK